MKVLDAAASRAADARTIAAGTPGLVLMERACAATARETVAAILARPLRGEEVVVLCGTGNNGGDGLGTALLLARSRCVSRLGVLVLGEAGSLRDDAAEMQKRASAAGVPLAFVGDRQGLEPLRRATLVVDALFGTGLCRPLAPGSPAGAALDALARRRVFTVAVDVPSGLDASRGEPIGPHVTADLTVTFGFPKLAHLLAPAAGACGRVVVADIGLLPVDDLAGGSPDAVTAADVAPFFGRRAAGAHKGTLGTLLVAGGAEGMAGAVALAAGAAFRSGAGRVAVAVAPQVRPVVHALVPEATSVASLDVPALDAATAVAVGPGLSRDERAGEVLRLTVGSALPAVFDADALNLAAGRPEVFAGRGAPTVLTPHPGEAARLLGVSTREIGVDRRLAALTLARRSGAVVVLKGFRSLVAAPDGRLETVLAGNPGMASGGMGDVLTGTVGAFLARGLDPFDAARAAAFVHGLAGDLVREARGEEALVAGDVVEALGDAFEALDR